MKFSLEPEETGTLSIYPEKSYTTYGPDYIEAKADRFAIALGNDSPGTDVLNNSITTGDQDRWALILKQREEVANSQRRNDIIRDIASTRDPMSSPTPDDIAVVSSLTDDSLYAEDLSTILEKKYSDIFTNTLSGFEENHVVREALEEDEEATLEVLDRSQIAQQRMLLGQDKLADVNKRYEDAGYFEKGVGFLKSAIPLYDMLKTNDAIAEVQSILPGNSWDEQITQLYLMDPPEFKVALDTAIDTIAADNIVLAQQFAQAVVSFSSTSKDLGNIFGVADILDVSTMGLTAAGKLAVGMAKAGKAVMRSPKAVAQAAADVGMTKTSAIASVLEDTALGDFSGVTKAASSPAELEARLPSIFAPQKAFTGRSTLESAANNRLRETITRSSDLAKDFLNAGVLVDRLEPTQLKMAAEEAFDRIKDTFTNVNHNIIDMQVIPAASDKITNTASVAIKFGRKDGSLFNTQIGAESFAKRYIGLKTNDFTVQQDGVGGYFVQVNRPVTDVGAYRKLEIPTELKTPDSLSNQFLTYARSADYKINEPSVRARGVVVHGQEYMAEYMKKITEPFRGKSKEWNDEMDKVFSSVRTNRKYYNTIEEFENNFLAINGKAPTEDQASAYFTYLQLNDLDYLIRDADVVKQKRAMGGEKISFKLQNDKGEDTLFNFDGIVRENLPYDSKTRYDVIIVDGNKAGKPKNSRFFGEDTRKDFDSKIAAGYKVIQNPEEGTYYLVKDFKRDNIPLGTLNRVEGGHNEYRHKHFIKQGKLKTGADRVTRYKGDTSLYVASTSKQAAEIAEVFEKARLMVKNSDPGARKFIDDNLPITYAEFIKKTVKGDIDVNVPILATRSGQRTADVRKYENDFEFFDDVMNSEHNAFSSVSGKYIGEKSETILDVLKSENGVVMRTDIEPLLSPMETLRSATSNILDVRLVNDYKAKSVRDWVQEFGHLIDAPMNKVLANPMEYLNDPKWATGANGDQVRLAKNVRDTILTLNNYRNPVESAMQNFKEKILSSVYDIGGEGTRKFVDDKLLFEANDATTFMRAAAFNMKLGFFNPKQLFLQASSVVNAISVTPKAGLQAARAMPITRMMLATDKPQVLQGLANKWAKFAGWEKGELLEMVESFKQSGFATVSNDVAYLDDFRPKTMAAGSKLGQVWSHHTMFFKEGELTARQVAYAAAYREWRSANPGAEMNRFVQGKVLARAKNLTTNMTRDSNAAWQKGAASVATQFMGYQARFMEQMWDGGLLKNGRKLSKDEKTRLVFGMGLMYGAPIYVGATTTLPMREYIREWMAEEGVVFDNVALNAFMDGVFPAMINAMTGVDLNISEVYGPNGLPTWLDIVNGDASYYDLMLGASGGVIADTLGSTWEAGKAITDMGFGDHDGTWPILMKDLLEPLKNITTVNAANNLYEAINTHRYLSRKGVHITDISVLESAIAGLTGAQPERVSDAYAKIAAQKATKEEIQKYQSEVEKWTRLGVAAARKGDEDSAAAYFSRARARSVAGNLSLKEHNTAVSRGMSSTPMDENVERTYQRRVIRRKQRSELGGTNPTAITEN